MVCNEFSVIQVEIGHCAKPTGYIEKLSTAGVGADWESNSEYLHRSSIFVGFALAFKGWVPDLRVKMIWEWRPNTTEYNVQQLWIVSFRKSSGKSTMSYTSLQACVKLFHCSVPGCMSLSLRVFFASHLLEWTVEHLADIILLVAAPVLYKGTKTTATKAAVQCGPLGLTEGRSGGHNVGVLQHRDNLRDLESPETTEFLQKI